MEQNILAFNSDKTDDIFLQNNTGVSIKLWMKKIISCYMGLMCDNKLKFDSEINNMLTKVT